MAQLLMRRGSDQVSARLPQPRRRPAEGGQTDAIHHRPRHGRVSGSVGGANPIVSCSAVLPYVAGRSVSVFSRAFVGRPAHTSCQRLHRVGGLVRAQGPRARRWEHLQVRIVLCCFDHLRIVLIEKFHGIMSESSVGFS